MSHRTAVNASVFACMVLFSIGASAQAQQCGPLSKWNGQACVAPKGKIYCPANMTMQGQTCVGAPENYSRVTPSPVLNTQPVATTLPGAESDHQKIMALLMEMSAQAKSQQAVINDLQQKLIAMQIVLNLTATNMDKAKVSSSNAEAAAAAVQASTASLSTSLSSLQAGSNALAGKVAAVQSQMSQLQGAQTTEAAAITDMAKRLLLTCLVVTGINNGIDGTQLNKNACTSTWWAGKWDFSTPFGK